MARRQSYVPPVKSNDRSPPPPPPPPDDRGEKVIKPKVWPLFMEGEVFTFGDVIRPELVDNIDAYNEMVRLMDHCYSNVALMESPTGVAVSWACRIVRRFATEGGGFDRVPVWLLFSEDGDCYCVRSPGMVDALDLVVACTHQPFPLGFRVRLDRVPTKAGFDRFTATFIMTDETATF